MSIIKWMTRLMAASLAAGLAVVGTGILEEATESTSSSPWALALAVAFILSGALLVFTVFFTLRLTRVVLSMPRGGDPQLIVDAAGRTLGTTLLAVGIMLIMASLALFAIVTIDAAPYGAALTVGSLSICGIGFGLRRRAPWSRLAALLLGFVLFGGMPIGTLLACYIWWFTASPVVRERFGASERGETGSGYPSQPERGQGPTVMPVGDGATPLVAGIADREMKRLTGGRPRVDTSGGPFLKGLLRLWALTSLFVVPYFSYGVYGSHVCLREARGALDFWSQERSRRQARLEEYENGQRRGLPEWQLPFFLQPPQDEIDEAREAIRNAAGSLEDCREGRWRSGLLLLSVPAITLGAVFGLVWVRNGFRGSE